MVQVLDSEDEPDKFLGVRTSSLVIACIDDSFEEEGEMALNRRKKGLEELLMEKNKEPTQKGASRSQHLLALLLSFSCS